VSETSFLLSLQALSHPALDAIFRLSHELGTLRFSVVLVLAAVVWHGRRGERREALAWLVVGLTTFVLFVSLKPAFATTRPFLWPRPMGVGATGFSFPSGHALAAATFFPLLAWVTLHLRGVPFALVGVGLALFVGFGRLYLGVHWPSDVLGGWLLGAAQAATAIRWIRSGRTSRPIAITVVSLWLGVVLAGWRPDRAIRVATGFVSHTLCYGAFISGQDPDAVYSESVLSKGEMRAASWALHYSVDQSRREVFTTFAGGFSSRAVYRDDVACLVVHGDPPPDVMPERRTVPDPSASPALPTIAGPLDVPAHGDAFEKALKRAFDPSEAGGDAGTKAVVIMQDGRVVAERYAPGYGSDTRMMGFSMTKSVTSALVGILVRQGRLRVDQPAPVEAWRGTGDPRGAITVDHLLRMTSGLALDEALTGFDPVSRMLLLERDMFAFAARAGLEVLPGTRWRYTSGNSMILSRILRDAAGGRAEDFLALARRELLEPLGLTSVKFGFDATGTPVGSSYLFASGRDWASFGLLYLNDGVVGGRRILPEGWVRYSTTRTLDSDYGAGFWLAPRDWQMAPDSYWAGGMAGQYVMVVPSERLVIVRLGARWMPIDSLARDVIEGLRVASDKPSN
jgi:hypothetical protein